MDSYQDIDLRVQVTNKQVISIALPLMLAMLVPQLNMLTNNIFLGRLGEKVLGNAGITAVFYLIFAVAGHGFNNAMQTVFSQYAGAGNHQHFKIILNQGIRITLLFAVVSILFVWLAAPEIFRQVSNPEDFPAEMEFLKIRIWGLPFLYLFQMGNAFLVASLNSRYLFYGFVAEALINILFDYLLIFGKFGFPQLGFNGAAVASVIAEAGAAFFVFAIIIQKGLKKRFQLLENFSYDKKVSSQVLRISLPLVFQYIISLTTWLIFFILIEERGTAAKAISNTMRNVFGIAGIFVWSFAATSNTMVGNLMGQKKYELVVPAIKKIMLLSFSSALIICGLLNIFPHLFFRMFGQDANFVQQAIPVVRMVTLGILSLSIANIWLNGVTGTGKTKVNLGIEIFAISSYLVYTWYVMKANYYSLATAWSNELAYWSVIFILSWLYMNSGKWKPKDSRLSDGGNRKS